MVHNRRKSEEHIGWKPEWDVKLTVVFANAPLENASAKEHIPSSPMLLLARSRICVNVCERTKSEECAQYM